MRERILLLIPTTSYKTRDFMDAADRLGIEVVVGTDRRQALEDLSPGHTLAVDLLRPERALHSIRELASSVPLRAVVGTDDETTLVAARAAAALSLPHNPIEAVGATRDKYRMRRRFAAAGLRGPRFRLLETGAGPDEAASAADYPCVLKPISLSAGRGVMRADGPAEFVGAFRRIVGILGDPDVGTKRANREHVLVEDYLPGFEVALEGLLTAGRLRVLALFDKPDPLEGPVFEETLFVTPSRLARDLQTGIAEEVQAGCEALGLVEGPVHAELRIHERRPWLLEIAARTIGGLCSRSLRFGVGVSLEELVLRHAVGRPTGGLDRERSAAGVMMLPVPRAGVLRRVEGIDDARSVPGVEDVALSLHRGAEVVPLPEGHRYLGFVFARGDEPAAVESALREAQRRLRIEIA